MKTTPTEPRKSFPQKEYKKPEKINKAFLIAVFPLLCWFYWKIGQIGGETYRSEISGMSDAMYSQCVELGSEVMEAQDDAYPDNSVTSSSNSNIKIYQNKYDQWNRSCGLQALQNMGVDFNTKTFLPSSPLDWAKQGK